jgi:hypothetical protein
MQLHTRLRVAGLVVLACLTLGVAPGARAADPLADLSHSGGDWGVYIDNGLVNPGEAVRMTASVPMDAPSAELPSQLVIHPRFLEEPGASPENVPLTWERASESNKWVAHVTYQPMRPGNYFASMAFRGQELFSYFAAWQKGITAINLWTQMAAEYHAPGNLKDLYLPEIRLGHLPVDFELVLVGESVFTPDWEPRDRFRRAQVETGAEVIPFFDGGYFHKLDPEFNDRFDAIVDKVAGPYRSLIPPATLAAHGERMLPDPNFHGLTVGQCSKIISGAESYWKLWGFRPFTGISTYGPSNELVDSCRTKGLKWISGIFADYNFVDGGDRWKGGWVQRHRGMPSFPYLASTTDFRRAGKADEQGTMMFPGWQNFPVWDHEDHHQQGTDPSSYHGNPKAIAERMVAYAQVFERDNQLAGNAFPLAVTFAIQMNHPSNPDVLKGLIEEARAGKVIFVHKRYLQNYFRAHQIDSSPDVTFDIPDSKLVRSHPRGFGFNDEAIWEGAQGKAAFISDPTALLPAGRSIHLPLWWYDFDHAGPLSPRVNLQPVDLSGVTLSVADGAHGKSLVVRSTKALDGLPICLWDLGVGLKGNPDWIRRSRALQIAAPERLGASATTWIIRPDIHVGENVIPLS